MTNTEIDYRSHIDIEMNESYYSEDELKSLSFKCIGDDVKISRFSRFYNIEMIEIGDHVRIDDFSIISGRVSLGNHVHIAAHCLLFGGCYGIEMRDFSAISSRCAVYAASDDYSGEYLTNPTVSDEYRGVTGGQVVLDRHVIVGTGSTVLPNCRVGEGTAVGSMSLVNRNLDPWGIYAGIPCVRIKERSKMVLELEKEYGY